jgi:hypothetical protein
MATSMILFMTPGKPAASLDTTFIRPIRRHSLNCVGFALDFFLRFFRQIARTIDISVITRMPRPTLTIATTDFT